MEKKSMKCFAFTDLILIFAAIIKNYGRTAKGSKEKVCQRKETIDEAA
jgi:hypothetical protein